jgi:hypothetical protein
VKNRRKSRAKRAKTGGKEGENQENEVKEARKGDGVKEKRREKAGETTGKGEDKDNGQKMTKKTGENHG